MIWGYQHNWHCIYHDHPLIFVKVRQPECHLLRLLRAVCSLKQANKIELKIGSFQVKAFCHFLSLDAILLLWKDVAAIEQAEYFRGTQVLSLLLSWLACPNLAHAVSKLLTGNLMPMRVLSYVILAKAVRAWLYSCQLLGDLCLPSKVKSLVFQLGTRLDFWAQV